MDIQSIISNLTGQTSVPTQNANIAFNPADYPQTSAADLLKQAYEQLKPYYAKLLADSNGDVNRAMGRLTEDYQTGTRYVQEDLASSMKNLGLQFGQEDTQQQDNLNQRGIALTQGADGKLQYGGGGEAGTEIGLQKQSQALRKEAEQRSADRATASAGLQMKRGQEDVARQGQQQAQGLQSEMEGQVANRANLIQGQQQQANQVTLQSKINTAQVNPVTNAVSTIAKAPVTAQPSYPVNPNVKLPTAQAYYNHNH